MDNPAFIVLFVILFLFCIYIGFLLGIWAGERAVTKADYWKYNAAFFFAAAVLFALAGTVIMLYAACFGMLAGGIAGLKMGFGESAGPWKLLDRFYNANKRHREVAERGGGQERRRRKRAGEQPPDLISVAEDGKKTTKNASNKASTKKESR